LTSNADIVGKGFQVQVGTLETDHREYAYKKTLRRNDKVKTVQNIDQTKI